MQQCKKFFLGLLGLIISLQLSAQSTHVGSKLIFDNVEGDVEYSFLEYISQVNERLGLSPNSGFDLIKNWTDYIGYEHHRMTQTIDNIPLEGAMFIVHSQNGIVRSANGHLIKGKFNNSKFSVNSEKAWDVVEKRYENFVFYHDVPDMEEWIKEHKNDPAATFFPEAKLVYIDPLYSENAAEYRLAWKFDIFTQKEIDHEIVYVDAQVGEIIHVRPMTTSGCFEHNHSNCSHTQHAFSGTSVVPLNGSGYTRYNGIQEFVADSVRPTRFRLFDETRGNGVQTLNANRRTTINAASDFINDNNFWDLRNPNIDEAALDAHWGASETFDFWMEEYNWPSYDGGGGRLTSYVHWDVAWFNASWNGMFARFGDGTGDPLTYIDITAHEFAHGLTGFSAGLIYADESGALNESFSDIFGTAVEFAALGDSAPWTLGIPTNPFRDMSNPNARNHPDTYLGRNWAFGSGDNGGVHTNSGVQNYWWYLLSVGGTTTNDNGDTFTVDSLGMKKATAIAFRTLTTYLVPSSTYEEARFASLLAAKDLYGACSPEVIAVSQAWAAVGIGGVVDPQGNSPDLELTSVDLINGTCSGNSLEPISLSFRLNPSGCDLNITANNEILIGYQVNDNPVVEEGLTLTQDLIEGDIFDYTFINSPDLSNPGKYDVKVWVHYEDDQFARNDTIASNEIRIPHTYSKSPATMVFLRPTFSLDSFYSEFKMNSSVGVTLGARNPIYTDRFGFEMTGKDASPNNIEFPTSETQNFVLNPNFGAKICFCVDASTWSRVFVAFDRRQTFSAIYRQNIGQDVPHLVSSMRLVLNEQQIGDQYHPTTYTDDPWERDTVEISQVAGSSFEFCFEGKHFIDRLADADIGVGTLGDYTYLDKIIFYDPDAVSNKNVNLVEMNIQPNPGSDRVWITMDQSDLRLMESLQVTNQLGEVVLTQKISQNVDQRIGLNTENLVPGVYFIQMRGNNQLGVAKWVKE